jgi:hypothetical protein
MISPDYEYIQVHQEAIRREAYIEQALRQSGMITPPLYDRGLAFLGDTLIRLGTMLKERAYTRLTAEEASAPVFMIML